MARPRIKVDEAKVRALAAIGLNDHQVAVVLGISPDTIQRRKRESTAFARALADGRAAGVAKVAEKLLRAAESGNTRAQMYYLDRVAKWGGDQAAVSVNVQAGDAMAFARDLVARIIAVLEREIPDPEQRRKLMSCIREEALRNG